MTVDVFIPCNMNLLFPETAWNVVKVLEYVGLEVHYKTEQLCCGRTSYLNGYVDDAREIGERFLNALKGKNPLICPSAACVAMVRNYYSELFFNTSLHNEYRQMQARIWEFTDYLVNVLRINDLSARFEYPVVYHPSCASSREYKLGDAPLKLLQHVKGIRICEMELPEMCCGYSAGLTVRHPLISNSLVNQKVESAMASGASYIVSTDISCLIHLQKYIDSQQIPLKTIHLADILASGL